MGIDKGIARQEITTSHAGGKGVGRTPDAPALRLESRELFVAGVRAWGYGDEALACVLGKTRGYVADVRSGRRPVPFHAVLALLDNRAAAHVVLSRQCIIAGFAMPVIRDTLEMTTSEARAYAEMRRESGPAIWCHIGKRLAARRGVELDLFDAALDERERQDRVAIEDAEE